MLPDYPLLVCKHIQLAPLHHHPLDRMLALASLTKDLSVNIQSQPMSQLRMRVQPRQK